MSRNDLFNDDILFQKEKEWRDLLSVQLEKAKSDCEKSKFHLNEYKEKYIRLEMDFKHNLRLLEERDKELNEIEEENIIMRESTHENENKISSLSVEIDKLKEELKTADGVKQDLREKLQQLMNKCFSDVQSVKNEKARELNRIRQDNETTVKNLERKIIELETESKENHFSLMADVEETLRSREDELQRTTEHVHREMLSYELKYRLASKELDLARASKAAVVTRLTEKEDAVRDWEMRFTQLELATSSEISVERMKRETEALQARDREAELAKEVERLSGKLNDKTESLRRKAELAKRLESDVKAVIAAGHEKERAKSEEIDHLQTEIEKWRNTVRELEEKLDNGRDDLRAKDAEIGRLVARMTDDNASKDGQMRTMRNEMDGLTHQLRDKHQQLMELRNELEYAIGKDLQASRVSDSERQSWHSKLETVRIEEMAKVESMIKAISRARDESLADAKELRKQLDDRKLVRLCANCSKEPSKITAAVEEKESQAMRELSQQNQQLKDIIAQMTEETTKQVRGLQQPAEVVTPTTNKHIASLAERNRQLQQEKIELLATSRKFQARLEATETDNHNLKTKIRERETEISQIKFELDSLQRHTGMDVRTMRRTVQELETELAVSRKESEEYYKGNLELGRVIEDLQSELTFLKSEQIENLPTLNFGAQEMLIEQLKQEIGELRGRLVHPGIGPNECFSKPPTSDDKDVLMLRKKLKVAANHIKHLAREKQVLIQISNRLRCEMKAAGVKLPSSGHSGKQSSEYAVENEDNKTIKRTIDDLEEKLSKLENLQKNLRFDYKDQRVTNGGQFSRSPRIVPSSMGRESVDEVFKLLDNADSLGKSSLFDTENRAPEKVGENNLLWAKSVKLNSPKTRTKRNMVTNRQ